MLQAASRWHSFISDWVKKNGYPTVNSEKTIFMLCEGKNFILHCMVVDDMMHTPNFIAPSHPTWR